MLLLPLAALLAFLIWHLYPRVDPAQGFDFQGHLDYLRYIDLSASLPLASQGWEMYLARLGVAATGGDPGPDPNANPPTENQ